MEDKSPQGMKVPLIVISVAVVVVAVGIVVRSGNSPSSPPSPEPAVATAPDVAPVLTREPAPVAAPSPEPSQQITFSSLASTDDQGDKWTLGLAGVPPQARDGATGPGVPLSVKADVQGSGRSISIGLIIEGQAGEVYEPGAAKNGRKRPAPRFKVFDETGKVLGSGSFEYG